MVNKSRICLDLSDLNKATKRHHHLPTTGEILPKLSNRNADICKFQTTLIVQNCSRLVRHRFKRMPYRDSI